jgi:hypothetical protein
MYDNLMIIEDGLDEIEDTRRRAAGAAGTDVDADNADGSVAL